VHRKLIHCLVVLAFLFVTAEIMTSAQNTPKAATLRDEINSISVEATNEFRRQSDPLIPSGEVRGTMPVASSDLNRIATSTQSLVIQRLGRRPEFAAMKDYVAARFPSPPEPTGRDPLSGAPVVPVTEGRAYADGVVAFLNRLGTKQLAVNLDIVTVPDGAEVEFKTAAVAGPATRSDATLVNIYRGLYSFRVSKALFKSAIGQLNLVDDDRQRFECTLARADDAANESSCLRR
jgi:hypothetical protein